MTGNHFSNPEVHSTRQDIDQVWLGNWLKAFYEEQQKQTGYLKNISSVATIIGLLLILTLIFGGCSVLGF